MLCQNGFDTLSQCVDALGLTRSVQQPDAHLSRGAALHFLLPTGQENILAMMDSRSGRRSFDFKLISLLPLDEVPVHVHRFAARVPSDSKGSECQCGIHTAEAASALRGRKTERAAKEKPTPISQFFLAPAAPGRPPREVDTRQGSVPRRQPVK